MGAGADVLKYRFQWNFPIFFSPHNPKRLYTAGNHLFVTENEGQSWQSISPDLTTNDKSKQGPSGGPITKDNTSVEYYSTIFTATESELEKDLLWTGSDDGLINVSKDGGNNWANVTPPAAGKLMMWNSVDISPFAKGKAYFVGTKYKSDDFTPYIFKTDDYGNTWKLITNGIPAMHFARVVRADKKVPGLLYCGTEYGMYISYNDGENWQPFQLNLPVVPITDVTIKDNDLVVATQGRALYILDDLGMVQQKQQADLSKNLYVFSAADAWRMEGSRNMNVTNAGINPPNGVVFNFYVKNKPDSARGKIILFDKDKKVIRTIDTKAKEKNDKLELIQGMNQYVWDMHYPLSEKIDGLILWNGNVQSPKVAPGTYSARFVVNKDSVEIPFVVKADPNYKMTAAQYNEQLIFLLQVQAKFNEVQKAIKNIRTIREQLNAFTPKLDTTQKEMKTLADTLLAKITRIEEGLYQTKSKSGQDVLNYPIRLNDKISGLFDFAASGYNPPSQQAKDTYAYLSGEADVLLNQLKQVEKNELQQFNKLIHEQKVPVIGVKE